MLGFCQHLNSSAQRGSGCGRVVASMQITEVCTAATNSSMAAVCVLSLFCVASLLFCCVGSACVSIVEMRSS